MATVCVQSICANDVPFSCSTTLFICGLQHQNTFAALQKPQSCTPAGEQVPSLQKQLQASAWQACFSTRHPQQGFCVSFSRMAWHPFTHAYKGGTNHGATAVVDSAAHTAASITPPCKVQALSAATKSRTIWCCWSVSGERRWSSLRVSKARCTRSNASSALNLEGHGAHSLFYQQLWK